MEASLDNVLTYIFTNTMEQEGYKEIVLAGITFREDKFGRYFDLPPSEWNIDALTEAIGQKILEIQTE